MSFIFSWHFNSAIHQYLIQQICSEQNECAAIGRCRQNLVATIKGFIFSFPPCSLTFLPERVLKFLLRLKIKLQPLKTIWHPPSHPNMIYLGVTKHIVLRWRCRHVQRKYIFTKIQPDKKYPEWLFRIHCMAFIVEVSQPISTKVNQMYHTVRMTMMQSIPGF